MSVCFFSVFIDVVINLTTSETGITENNLLTYIVYQMKCTHAGNNIIGQNRTSSNRSEVEDVKIGFVWQTFKIKFAEFDMYISIALQLIYQFHVYIATGRVFHYSFRQTFATQ